ncbi:MAG: arginase [Bacteroidetes bacterium]|nr:arginase [Bacteroidota bacterium]
MKNVKFITIESDFGAGKKGAKLGPQALLNQLKKRIPDWDALNQPERVLSEDLESDNEHPFLKNIYSILEVQKRAVLSIQKELENNAGFPVILSGDHSNGSAAISAIKNAFPEKRLGVIWIDAHADLHNPFSTPSGNMHGMPLAIALGLKHEVEDANEVSKSELELWQELLELGSEKISPKILAQDLVLIDIRDLEEDEIDTIRERGILSFSPAECDAMGIQEVINKSLEQLSDCDHILVSFDVDSLDPEISIGTGTPVPNGLTLQEASELLNGLLKSPKTVALEITEVNPLLDRTNPMEEIAADLFITLIDKN